MNIELHLALRLFIHVFMMLCFTRRLCSQRAMAQAVLMLGATLPLLAQAQVYRCDVAGKVEYQQQPCAAAANGSGKLVVAANDQPNLWTNLTRGMTVDEVLKAVPQAKLGDDDKLRNGARSLVWVNRIAAGGQDFDARFFFLNDRFHRVNFSGPMNYSNQLSMKTFEKISETFQRRYGPPADKKFINEQMGMAASATWNTNRGEVWIILVPVTADTAFVNFGFVPK